LKQLDINCIKRWVAKGSSKLSQPASIGISCPECSMRGVFSTKRRYYDEYRDTLSCSADCPACNTQVHFWIHDLIGHDDVGEDDQPTLYMSPASNSQLDFTALPDTVPTNVLHYCSSTQDVYQTGNLTATCVLAQSTLDALFTEFLPVGNSSSNLAKLITDSMPSIDLQQPLEQLATSLRKSGHLKELLDNRQHASPDTAEALMQLLEGLLTYLYVIPEEFARLDQKFVELNKLVLEARQAAESDTSAKAGGAADATSRRDSTANNDDDDDASPGLRRQSAA